jgi:hypothetical protein
MRELFSGVLGVTLAGAWMLSTPLGWIAAYNTGDVVDAILAAVIPFYGLIAFLSWII